MLPIAKGSELERVSEMLGLRRPPEDAQRAKLRGRLASLSELLRETASAQSAAAAIGWAALMLTGASRCAVFIRTSDGGVSCPWSHLLPDAYVARLCTPAGPSSWVHLSHHLELASMDLAARGRARSVTPSIVEDVCVLPAASETRRTAEAEGLRAFCSWPLGREGRVFGAVVYYFDAPHVCDDQEREVVLDFVAQASAALSRALAADLRSQIRAHAAAESELGAQSESGAAGMQGGASAAPEAAPELQTEIEAPPVLDTGPDNEDGAARLLTLQRVVQAEAARLRAERTNLCAERVRLAAAQRELEAERERLAEMRGALDAEPGRPAATPPPAVAPAVEAAAGADAERGTPERPRAEAELISVETAAPSAPAGAPESLGAPAAAEPASAVTAPAAAPGAVPTTRAGGRPLDAAVCVELTKATALGRAYLGSVEKYRGRLVRWLDAAAAALHCSVNDVAEIREAAALLYDIEASSRTNLAPSVAAIFRHREEHWDGTGRPDGLAGNAIPLGARLLAVALTYAEMVIGRPGAPMLYHMDAKAALRRDAGRKYDPEVVAAFCRVVTRT